VPLPEKRHRAPVHHGSTCHFLEPAEVQASAGTRTYPHLLASRELLSKLAELTLRSGRMPAESDLLHRYATGSPQQSRLRIRRRLRFVRSALLPKLAEAELGRAPTAPPEAVADWMARLWPARGGDAIDPAALLRREARVSKLSSSEVARRARTVCRCQPIPNSADFVDGRALGSLQHRVTASL